MKEYNYLKIKKEVEKIIKTACCSKDNFFSCEVLGHVLLARKYSLVLGKKLKADLEVLELAALLHDYANIKNYQLYDDEHHIFGAKFAGEILEKTNLPLEKIRHIQECIYVHRGRVAKRKISTEAKILASADAMSHITNLPSMFFLVYNVHKYSIYRGCEFLEGKIRRSWKKIMPIGKKIVKDDYDFALKILRRGKITYK